jgi:hypothetical protein
MTVTAFTHCKVFTCREPITVRDVVREKDVADAPQHVVVIFKCPKCGRTDRAVGSRENWSERLAEAGVEEAEIDGTLVEARLELGLFDNVAELEALWRSYPVPPMIEELKGSCQCDDCRRRRGDGPRPQVG